MTGCSLRARGGLKRSPLVSLGVRGKTSPPAQRKREVVGLNPFKAGSFDLHMYCVSYLLTDIITFFVFFEPTTTTTELRIVNPFGERGETLFNYVANL